MSYEPKIMLTNSCCMKTTLNLHLYLCTSLTRLKIARTIIAEEHCIVKILLSFDPDHNTTLVAR